MGNSPIRKCTKKTGFVCVVLVSEIPQRVSLLTAGGGGLSQRNFPVVFLATMRHTRLGVAGDGLRWERVSPVGRPCALAVMAFFPRREASKRKRRLASCWEKGRLERRLGWLAAGGKKQKRITSRSLCQLGRLGKEGTARYGRESKSLCAIARIGFGSHHRLRTGFVPLFPFPLLRSRVRE